jgi:hypothetical protein
MRFLLAFLAVLAVSPFSGSSAAADTRCSAVPQAGCRQPFVPHKSVLAFKQTGATDPDDIYSWRWQSGSATDVADFGDPLGTTDYVLCIYDQSARPQPVVENLALAATGWESVRGGFVRDYRPSRSIRRVSLRAGRDGKAKILVHGDSDTVRDILPFVAPVVVQMQTNGVGCWETSLTTPSRNDASRFQSKD